MDRFIGLLLCTFSCLLSPARLLLSAYFFLLAENVHTFSLLLRGLPKDLLFILVSVVCH